MKREIFTEGRAESQGDGKVIVLLSGVSGVRVIQAQSNSALLVS